MADTSHPYITIYFPRQGTVFASVRSVRICRMKTRYMKELFCLAPPPLRMKENFPGPYGLDNLIMSRWTGPVDKEKITSFAG